MRFAAFKAAEDAAKAAAAAEAAAEAAAAAAEKRDEQSRAVASFRRQIEKYLEDRYKQSDDEIIRLGKIWKITNGGDYEGHEWVRLWRESRYSGRIARRLNASEPQPGFDFFDGWPTKDEADIEVAKIAYMEWQKWVSFCIRFAERAT